MSKWFKQLMDSEGSVDKTVDPYREENMVRSDSPSFNWIFANKGGGAPRNSTSVYIGQPKAGKSVGANAVIANELARDPEAIAITFNTEIRGALQTGSLFGIDPKRHITYDLNGPGEIFDKIEKEIIPMVLDGMPLKILVIDSLNGIRGIKSLNTESVEDHLMGDEALTLKNGLKRVVPLLKKHNIHFIATAHMAANIGAVGMHAPKFKAALSWFARHVFEFFILFSRDNSAEGKTDALGNKFENDSVKDFKGNKQITGHKIYVTMDENSLGTSKRSGQFTIDYKKGVVGQEEEYFELAKNCEIVERPNNRTYIYEGITYTSKEQFIDAIKASPEIQKSIFDRVRAKDA